MYEQELNANILIDCNVPLAGPGLVEGKNRTGSPIEGRSFPSSQSESITTE